MTASDHIWCAIHAAAVIIENIETGDTYCTCEHLHDNVVGPLNAALAVLELLDGSAA
jgi:hypothetical protein